MNPYTPNLQTRRPQTQEFQTTVTTCGPYLIAVRVLLLVLLAVQRLVSLLLPS